MNQPVPGPRPGPAGPDLDALRVAFADRLEETAPHGASDDVTDDHVEALDRAHTLLSEALESLDGNR